MKKAPYTMAGGSLRSRRDGPPLIQPTAETADQTGKEPGPFFPGRRFPEIPASQSGRAITAWASGLDTTGRLDFFPYYEVHPLLGYRPSDR